MTLDDPLFVIPSSFFIRHARHGFRNGAARFQFQASMALTANEIWSPHRVLKADLGNRLIQILDELPATTRNSPPSAALWDARNVIWVPAHGAAVER